MTDGVISARHGRDAFLTFLTFELHGPTCRRQEIAAMPETTPGLPLSKMNGAAPAGANRRNSARAPIDVLANRFLGGYPYMCRLLDISRSGLRLRRLHEPRTSFRFVGLQFQVPGRPEVISAAAEVVFSDDRTGEVGLRFTRLSPADADLIDGIVSGRA
jgi:hypothetical protein